MAQAIRAMRLAGLFAIMCGLMGIGAVTAQAEPGAQWKVNGVAITTALKVQGQASLVGNHGIVLTKVGLSTVEILCTTLEFAHVLLEELGGGRGKIGVKGCITKLNGKEAAACVPHSPGLANGVIITNSSDGLIKLHTTASGSKVDLVELLPESGSVFLTLVMGKEGASECAIGAKFDITGKIFVKDSQEEGLVEKVTHEIEEGPLSALFFGGNAMKIDGKLKVFLAGPHAGMTVSGIAG